MKITGKAIVHAIHVLSAVAHGAQIFALAPIFGTSHWNVMDAVLQTLASAGHNVTVITPFVRKEKIANYTQINAIAHSSTRPMPQPFETCVGFNGVEYLIKTHQKTCEAIYGSKDFWTALRSNKYDLFVTQLLGSGCDAYIAHELQVPMIAVTTSAMPTWYDGLLGNPFMTSSTSTIYVPMARPRTFWDRLSNGYDYVYTNAQRAWHDRNATVIGRTYFGRDAPDADTLMKNISLFFVNSHFAFDLPRPWLPNSIEIGGIHVTDPKPLPEEIQQFMDDAPDGVIYFSFGSIIEMDSIPEKLQSALQEAFSELPQRILWKYDGDVMKNQPKNVMIKKWFPQRDILAHPKLKLFVYHGGLSGMNEAIANKVPILGIPLFADQFRNIANAVYSGMGLSLDHKTLDKQSVLVAVKELINDEKYKKNVQELYRLFNDRPMSPKALVTYWTDYVINHKGAKHLRSPAIDLSWYEYHQLDVLLFVLSIATSVFAVLVYGTIVVKISVIRFVNLKKVKAE